MVVTENGAITAKTDAALANAPDNAVERKDAPCPIVGIGASAGGIAALQKFFPGVAPDSGLAYVVIQHLDAEHDSALASIIQRCAKLESEVVKDETRIEPNRIYVIPPGSSMTVKDCCLHITKMSDQRSKRTPIDDFLISLAEDQGENPAGVILSGTGSDGTIGLRAIKEQGGLTLAQESAEYDGMMRSAVQTGLVDMVLPAETMAGKLVDYFRHLTRVSGGKAQTDPAARHCRPAFAHCRTAAGANGPRFQRLQGQHHPQARPAPHAGVADR